jgi:hypothetical protein
MVKIPAQLQHKMSLGKKNRNPRLALCGRVSSLAHHLPLSVKGTENRACCAPSRKQAPTRTNSSMCALGLKDTAQTRKPVAIIFSGLLTFLARRNHEEIIVYVFIDVDVEYCR